MCTVASLTNIAKACQVMNTGGLLNKIYLSFQEEITAIPSATGNVISTALTMATSPSAGTFKTVEISRKNVSFEVTMLGDEENAGGFNVKATFRVLRISAAISTSLMATNNAPIIAIVPDNNSNNRLLGDLTNPCYVRFNEKISDTENYYEVELNWMNVNHVPYFYTSTIPLS